MIDGAEASDAHFQSYVVDRDIGSPDMAAIVLANQGDVYSSKQVGATIEIKVGNDKTSVFKGEIIGLEPVYKGGDKTIITIRAMNKLHRLLRKRKSLTFTDKTDQQILNQVVGDAGLTLDWKHETSITYKHVYQHNQTDLEFLRTRAARMGCHVWCVDTTVNVKQPDVQSGPIATLNVDQEADAVLHRLAPRLNSSAVINKVTCKGWNPETKELITGDATVQSSKLGSKTSVAGSGSLGNEETFTVDHPIWSAEEAKALAKARLQDASLSYITGEAEVAGNPVFDLGKVVKVVANAMKGDDPFNGNYYLMGVTHRHIAAKAKEGGGYVTILRFARDAQAQ
ncbi:MAG TPA: contractile injection system protein, VgrG/Pvc8 family [Kofleriaceae bacterium]|jgi:phage protein D|nr:contractile injection system protein, VgrG/Pvc8 family [Kofleriaceae bacterium]